MSDRLDAPWFAIEDVPSRRCGLHTKKWTTIDSVFSTTMPVKGKSKVTDRQRAQIAAGKIAGKSHRAIAAETGLAKTTVDHQATDPRVSTLTLRLKRQDEERL